MFVISVMLLTYQIIVIPTSQVSAVSSNRHRWMKKHLINDKIMHTQWIQMKHIGLKGFLTYAESALDMAPYQNGGFGTIRTFQIKSNNNKNNK